MNLFLLIGVFNRVAWLILVWLLAYAVGICGCIILFGFMLNILLVRDTVQDDVLGWTFLLCVIPLLMALTYLICWLLVLKLWKQIKKRETQVFVCVD